MYLLSQLLEIYRLVILAAVIVSWVAPGSRHPVVLFIKRVTDPVFDAVRKVLPPMGGFDLSPLVVLIGLSILTRLI